MPQEGTQERAGGKKWIIPIASKNHLKSIEHHLNLSFHCFTESSMFLIKQLPFLLKHYIKGLGFYFCRGSWRLLAVVFDEAHTFLFSQMFSRLWVRSQVLGPNSTPLPLFFSFCIIFSIIILPKHPEATQVWNISDRGSCLSKLHLHLP